MEPPPSLITIYSLTSSAGLRKVSSTRSGLIQRYGIIPNTASNNAGQPITAKNQIDTDIVKACQRLRDNDPIKSAIPRNNRTSPQENARNSPYVSRSIGLPSSQLITPISPYPKATIVNNTAASPIYLPVMKDKVPIGYVDNSCQLPSSFSAVNEKEPRNSVIKGKRYKIRFSIEPVVLEYPCTGFCAFSSNKLKLNVQRGPETNTPRDCEILFSTLSWRSVSCQTLHSPFLISISDDPSSLSIGPLDGHLHSCHDPSHDPYHNSFRPRHGCVHVHRLPCSCYPYFESSHGRPVHLLS